PGPNIQHRTHTQRPTLMASLSARSAIMANRVRASSGVRGDDIASTAASRVASVTASGVGSAPRVGLQLLCRAVVAKSAEGHNKPGPNGRRSMAASPAAKAGPTGQNLWLTWRGLRNESQTAHI